MHVWIRRRDKIFHVMIGEKKLEKSVASDRLFEERHIALHVQYSTYLSLFFCFLFIFDLAFAC